MKAHRILFCLLLLGAPTAQADLQIYELPIDASEEIAGAIYNVLPVLCDNLGTNCRASELPNRQLLVEAPADVHQQLTAVLRTIRANAGGPTPRLTLHYWMLSATRGADDAGADSLAPLRPVLDEIERLSGELGFTLVDRITITSDSGQPARLFSGNIENWTVQQSASVNGDRLSASIQSNFALFTTGPDERSEQYRQEFSANVTLDRGEFLVLGEASTPGLGDETHYYVIVHWPDAP